ncbi:hypothetical protein L3Q72_15465 [Vibrio sp. JC009]|uniref:hypothetical protein n=1 Tax=Vibrio sp. JC009 TaxID=2912314 RepID=UPI0023AEDF5C|nr:hypothetical protein [Vibrio sp. JC009]WED24280.1 hypothetical protein L3Q72_15465 [Vibrio sp. JC009]
MTTYQEFKSGLVEVLDEFCFYELIEDTVTDKCGSTYSMYSNGQSRYMLHWDAEEAVGLVERWQDSKWKAFKATVPNNNQSQFDLSLNKLRKKLKKHIMKNSEPEATAA